MEKVSYNGLCRLFRAVESVGGGKVHITGKILFTQDSFTKEYREESRTYVVSSDNKAYIPGMGGYSIFGSSMDGLDKNVRLEQYMAAEYGGKDGWKVEKCFIEEADLDLGIEAIAQQQLDNLAPLQDFTEPCPRCGGKMARRNAISRRSKLEVCPSCGTDEAIRELLGKPLKATEWWTFRSRDFRKEVMENG